MRNLEENPVIEKVLIISTGHITKSDADILDSKQEYLYVEKYEWGYTIPVQLEKSSVHIEFAKCGLSSAIANIYRTAIDMGVDFIRLDSDGPKYADLPKFNW